MRGCEHLSGVERARCDSAVSFRGAESSFYLGLAAREGARSEERVADALLGGGVGSAADFNASGADGGGGSGPHGRDAGRISLPSDSYA